MQDQRATQRCPIFDERLRITALGPVAKARSPNIKEKSEKYCMRNAPKRVVPLAALTIYLRVTSAL